MPILKITQTDSDQIFENVMPKVLWDILDDLIDEGDMDEVFNCLKKNMNNSIPGSYLMYKAYILNNAHFMIRNAYPEDPIVKAVCETEQEIIQF